MKKNITQEEYNEIFERFTFKMNRGMSYSNIKKWLDKKYNIINGDDKK